MSNISRLSGLTAGMQRGNDLSSNNLIVSTLQVGGGSGTTLTKTILDNLVSIQGGSNSFYYLKTDFTVTSAASRPVLLNASGKLDSGLIDAASIDHSALQNLNTTNYTHLSAANASALTGAADTTLHFHSADRNRANHTGTQASSTISDFSSAVESNVASLFQNGSATTAVHTTGNMHIDVVQSAIDHVNLQHVGSNSHTQIDSHIADSTIHHSVASVQGITGGMVANTTTINMSYNSGAQTISAAVNNTSITDGMLAGSISDSKLANSYLYANGTRAVTGKLTYSSAPTFNNDLDIVDKAYVDAVAQGLVVRTPARVATTGLLSVTASGSGVGKTLTFTTFAVQSIDNHVLILTDRVLVKDQTTQKDNGIYVVTQLGDGSSVACVLTRASDFDGTPASEVVAGDFLFIQAGTQNVGSGWVLKSYNNLDPVIDTDPVVFIQFSAAGAYTADGNGITLNGNQFSLVLDGSTLAKSSSGLKIANAGVTATQIASGSFGNGLTGGSGTQITVNHDGNGFTFSGGQLSLQLDGTTLSKSASGLKVNTIGTANISANAVDDTIIRLRSNSYLRSRNNAGTDDINIIKTDTTDHIVLASIPSVATGTPSANGDLTTKLYVDNAVSGKSDASQITYTASTVGNWNGSSQPGNTNAGLDQLASRLKTVEGSTTNITALYDSYIAGASLSSGVCALRFMKAGDSGYTAGRVIKADYDATSADNFYCLGLALAANQNAGDSITVVKAGNITITGHGLTVGQPFYLGATGALTSTSPSTVNQAVVILGLVKDANTLEVQVNYIGVV